MDGPNTVAGLIEKHRAIGGQIDAKRREPAVATFSPPWPPNMGLQSAGITQASGSRTRGRKPMRPMHIAAIALAGGLTFAAAAAAQAKAPATPPAEEAAPTPPNVPPAAAREKSEGAEHAADVAKDRASAASAVAPDATTDVDAAAKTPTKDTDEADPNEGKKKHTTREPGHGPSPAKPH